MMSRTLGFFIIILIPMLASGQARLMSSVKSRPGAATTFGTASQDLYVAVKKGIVKANSLSGMALREYYGHDGSVLSLRLSIDGRYLLSGNDDKTVRRLDLQTSEIKPFQLTEKVADVHFAGSNDHYIAMTESGSVIGWSEEGQYKVLYPADKRSKILTVNPQGNVVVVGNSEGQLTIIDTSNGNVVKEWPAHMAEIRSLAYSHSGKFLFTAADDGTLKKWNTTDWSLIKNDNSLKGKVYNLSISKDDSHISASTGSGCVILNTTSLSSVATINKLSSIPLYSEFSPDGKMLVVVQDFVPKAEVWDISFLGISEFTILKDASDKTPPQLYVSSPANTSEGLVIVYTDLLAIKGTVIDDAGVSKLRINGIETPMRDNGNFTIMQPLVVGENMINIEATDINGNTSLKKFIVSRRNVNGEVYDASKARNYLMVVGINAYEYWPRLNNAVKDANDITQTLKSIYNFNFDDITLLTNESATRNNIYKALREFVMKVTPQDNFMIYFSGHGYFDELLNEGYWVPVEAKVNNTGDYLSNSDILKIIGNINSQHTFLVADACFSGSLFSDTKRGYADNVEKFKSRWGLASGRLEVVSDGQEGNNSPFAKNFIEFLKKNEEEKISVSQLVQHVKMAVAETSDQTPIGNPLKSVGDEGGEFVFYKRSN